MKKTIKNALISVYNKENLQEIVNHLYQNNIKIYSTGGTSKFIKDMNIPVNEVEDLTSYPSILGGRVKTLHPKVFGGILARRSNQEDIKQLNDYQIPEIDLVIVDLYPFKETVKNGGTFEEVIEKIDIGGVALIRAAAKNFNDTIIICKEKSRRWFVNNNITETTLKQRMKLSSISFKLTNKYDKTISKWMKNNLIQN